MGPGDCLLGDGRLGRLGGGRPWLHSRGKFPGVFGAPVGLVLGGDELDGVGAVELQGVAQWLVRGAAPLVELLMAVPGHPDPHPAVSPRVLEAVLDRTLTPDPVARVVFAESLFDFRAFLELWVQFGLRRCVWREGG